MPFTLSHPAAVLPLAKTRLDLSALVVGSMSPDFIYFIYLNPRGESTHTLTGIFLYCLPAGLLALAIYHVLLKMPLQAMLSIPAVQPVAESSKLFRLPTIRRLSLVMLSLLIGALTHVAWDAFTHENNWLVQVLPFLNLTVFDLGFDRIPLTRVLHHASSIVGGLVLIVWTRRNMRTRNAENDSLSSSKPYSGSTLRSVMLWMLVSAAAGLLFAWTRGHPIQNFDEFRLMMVQALVATGSAFFTFTFIYSIVWRMTRKRVSNG